MNSEPASHARQLIDRYVQSVTRGDFSGIGKLFAEQAVYQGPVADLHGRRQIAAFLEMIPRAEPPESAFVLKAVTDADSCFAELLLRFSGDGHESVIAMLVTATETGEIGRMAIYGRLHFDQTAASAAGRFAAAWEMRDQ
jgi:SnoaL-like domain